MLGSGADFSQKSAFILTMSAPGADDRMAHIPLLAYYSQREGVPHEHDEQRQRRLAPAGRHGNRRAAQMDSAVGGNETGPARRDARPVAVEGERAAAREHRRVQS